MRPLKPFQLIALMSLLILLLSAILSESLTQTAEPDVTTWISSLDFSPDGSLLAVGKGANSRCRDSLIPTFGIHLLDVVSGNQEQILGHRCPVVSLSFNFDGTILASSDRGGDLWTWDVLNKHKLIQIFTGALPYVEWSPFQNLFLEFNGYTIFIEDQNRDLVSDDASRQSPNGEIKAAVWNPQGDKIAFGDIAGMVSIWNTMNFEIEQTVNHHRSAITALDWNPIHNVIASADETGVINVWNAETGELIAFAVTPQTIRDLVWSPDGELLASAGDDGIVHLWTVSEAALTEVKTLDYHAPVYALAWSPDGTTLAYGGEGIEGQNGQVQLADVLDLITSPDRPCSPRHY